MTTTALAKVGSGAVSTAYERKVPRNREGQSYREWLDTAAVSSTPKHFKAWKECKNPTEMTKRNPGGGMSTEAKIAIGVLIGVGVLSAAAAGIYLYKKSQEKKSGGGGLQGVTWTPTTIINPGQRARMSLDPQVLQQILGVAFNDQALGAWLHVAGISSYRPGTPLPPDWAPLNANPNNINIEFANPSPGPTINTALLNAGALHPVAAAWVAS